MKEKPKPILIRLYKNERRAIKFYARKRKISEAEVIRQLIQNRFLYEDGTFKSMELI